MVQQISLRPAQSFLLKNQAPKLQPQIPTMMPPSAQPPRTQTPPLGQVRGAFATKQKSRLHVGNVTFCFSLHSLA